MKPDQELVYEWRMIVQDSLMCVMQGQDDMADRAIIAMDDYIAWLESEMEDKQ